MGAFERRLARMASTLSFRDILGWGTFCPLPSLGCLTETPVNAGLMVSCSYLSVGLPVSSLLWRENLGWGEIHSDSVVSFDPKSVRFSLGLPHQIACCGCVCGVQETGVQETGGYEDVRFG